MYHDRVSERHQLIYLWQSWGVVVQEEASIWRHKEVNVVTPVFLVRHVCRHVMSLQTEHLQWAAGELVPISSSLWARGRVHPGQIVSPSQGNTHTTMHTL
ncbi:hypothetical protein AMECASPLE_007583 [Ameca splendens]|uniref:Uncharacterized protein n=1 Tax=Ameca splendens TaxID=208324 RepID=A0ABV0XZL1_9TELE